jgi:hypothetical protein
MDKVKQRVWVYQKNDKHQVIGLENYEFIEGCLSLSDREVPEGGEGYSLSFVMPLCEITIGATKTAFTVAEVLWGAIRFMSSDDYRENGGRVLGEGDIIVFDAAAGGRQAITIFMPHAWDRVKTRFDVLSFKIMFDALAVINISDHKATTWPDHRSKKL